MTEEEKPYFEKIKSAIKQEIDGNLIRINDEFKNEEDFFDWLANQNQNIKGQVMEMFIFLLIICAIAEANKKRKKEIEEIKKQLNRGN